jgi:chaperonin GroEL (HSP60 family)
VRARDALKGLTGDNADQSAGIAIVHRALATPLRQIVANAGLVRPRSSTPWNGKAEATATTPRPASTAT